MYLDGYKNSEVIAKNLKLLFGAYRLKILIWFREQCDFLESIYLQEVHTGYTDTFDTFFKTIPYEKFDWLKILDNYCSHFGKEIIIAHLYNNDVLSEFIKDVGIGHLEENKIFTNKNVSYNVDALEYAMMVNGDLTVNERKTLRSVLQNEIEFLGDRKTFISPDLRKSISDKYRENNLRLFEKIDTSGFKIESKKFHEITKSNYRSSLLSLTKTCIFLVDKSRDIDKTLKLVYRKNGEIEGKLKKRTSIITLNQRKIVDQESKISDIEKKINDLSVELVYLKERNKLLEDKIKKSSFKSRLKRLWKLVKLA